jgi:hypothetical protein
MARCSGIRADGGRCGAQAIRSTEFCVNHHPDYEDARRRRNSKGGKRGGRGRPQAELANVKQRLSDLADDVLEGRVERGTGAVVSQVLNVYLRAVAVEMKVKEVGELEERLASLEEASERGGPGGRRWGA